MIPYMDQFERDYREIYEARPSETGTEISEVADAQGVSTGLLSRLSPTTRHVLATALHRAQAYGTGGAAVVIAKTFHLGGSVSGPCTALFIEDNVSRLIGRQGSASTACSDLRFISRCAIEELNTWRRRMTTPRGYNSLYDRDLEQGGPDTPSLASSASR